MRLVFMGTPDFAVKPLKALIENGYEVAGVFTQPDKPVGRKAVLTAPPVKITAVEYGIPVFQPVTLKNGAGAEILKKLAPDAVIVIAYGKILPDDVLNIPKYGCINIHGSILPKYRGAAPIQWSVINGDTLAGVTSMQMDSGIDTGDMLLSESTPIGENETTGELYERLSDIGADLLIKTLKELENGTLKPIKQDESQSCYAAMLDKTLSAVDWNEPAFKVHKKICGLDPWPVATAVLDSNIIKLFSSRLLGEADGVPGSAVAVSDGIAVTCGDKRAVLITEVQAQGKKRMKSVDFLRGHPLKADEVLL